MKKTIESLVSNIDTADRESIRRAIAEAMLIEREECARICDLNSCDYTKAGAEVCAIEIRSRSTYRV